MKKKILVLGIVLALVSVLAVPMAALATHEGEQQASTSQSTSLEIVAKDNSTAVAVILFPPGLAGADIENPSNNVDGTGVDSEQLYSASASLPVVRIKNATGGNLVVTITVSAWTNSVVASERYLLVQSTDTTVEAGDVTAALSGTVATGITIDDATVGHLYLEVTLGAVSAKSGTSDITILGETP